MSAAQLSDVLQILLRPFPPFNFCTMPSTILNWRSTLALDRSIITHWQTFSDIVAEDILSYSKAVMNEAANSNPRVAQTMSKLFYDELARVALSFPNLHPIGSFTPSYLPGFLWEALWDEGMEVWEEDVSSVLNTYEERFGSRAWTLQDAYDLQARRDEWDIRSGLLIRHTNGQMWSVGDNCYVY
ncbi:hypothetical protein GYMLUDRAFT_240634 [Collybiopsis luxurians FD-317 M1]|nr:hypothetical protein GYMLUDRAFT_240634 [Collybiopsis luxurians FD-317 M1]